ncbi:3733_t:CDS:1 [Diversispora eburnea]|uniref:3733_t:CDS:1 n=1 Tax=Diversispora eburnea TaxID=1213867 RepID=A0A9N8WTP1_9GLOM|nr:3733_t:CDS:1 [Diversispora eburnea]
MPRHKSQFYSTRSTTTSSGQSSNNYDDYCSEQQSSVSPSQRDFTAATTTTTTTNTRNKENPKWFSSLSFIPSSVPRRVLSSSIVQVASLVMIYSLCMTFVMIIFCTSYFLTFYDNTRRTIKTSRVWSQIKSGIRNRASMLGGDWEEFLQKYFDQSRDGFDVNRNGHLGGFSNQKNFNGNNNSKDKEWEDWLKNTMFKFMTVVVGQEISNKFQQTTQSSSFWAKQTTPNANRK